MSYQDISSLYGQIMGYGRMRIRREVARNTLLSKKELADQYAGLFQKRVRNALAAFPAFAAKVKKFRGSIPEGYAPVRPEELPVWTREDQRHLFDQFPAPPVPGSFVHRTGGSTGVPVQFCVTRESYEWRMAVSDRGYSWAEAEEGRKSFYVWGSPIKPTSPIEALKTRLHHAFQRRTYFDSFHFDDRDKAACCLGIDQAKPQALVGYAGNLVELARYARDNRNLLKWRAHTLVTGAEGLQPGQRQLLGEQLADKVFMSYGSREFMLIGMECSQHCGYHISSDNLFVEVVDDDGKPVRAGQTGRILVTDLHNDATPFIRYDIGDLGTMSGEACSCGLPFPLLVSVDGRQQEVLYKPDGSRMTALFVPHLMKEFDWVDGYQLVQERVNSICVNVISSSELSIDQIASLVTALRGRLGEGMQVDVKRVTALARSRSGKTPIVVDFRIAHAKPMM